MGTLSRDVKNTFNFLRWRRASVDAVLGDLPICDLNPIELVLPAPTNLVATAFSAARINLSWDDNSTNEVEFQIERSLTPGSGFTQIAVVAPNVTSYQDSGLNTETQYYYRVRAVSISLVSDYSNEASATTLSAFSTQWNTANPGDSASNAITLPLVSDGTYNFVVEWGDGNFDTITSFNQSEVSHSYSSFGIYNVQISGVIQGWSFSTTTNNSDPEKLIQISKWSTFQPKTTAPDCFVGCSNMELTATDTLDLSQTTSLQRFFFNCSSMTALSADFSTWGTSGITNMDEMFSGCSVFNQTVDSWNVTSVSTIQGMFSGASNYNQDMNSWQTDSLVLANSTFFAATSFNGEISNWNMSQVSQMGQFMRFASSFNRNIADWDLSSCTTFSRAFEGCTAFNGDVTNWVLNTSTNVNFQVCFKDCINFNKPVNNWNTSRVFNFFQCFLNCTSFDKSISNWDFTTCISTREMFSGCSALNQSFANLSFPANTSFRGMFLNCISLNSSFANITLNPAGNMEAFSMFEGCTIFNQDLSSWDMSKISNMNSMLQSCPAFDQNLSSWDVSNVVDFTSFLEASTSFNSPIFNITSTTEGISLMFNGASSFNQNLSGWNVTGIIAAISFLNGSAFSTANLDLLYNAWEAQAVQDDVVFSAGSTQYTIATSGAARGRLISDHNWTITDGGGV